ncbi:2-keto-4-pentenoate hydratase [Evansella clarkii]|uniref:2-keto-4-pentenoate hydratase n=1 Tax=Evansella clarkii TaxID=79879 RepID=UPI000997D6B7|nr:2-keto-4-pentenoate hydratase [Evansella clarkii]
MSVKIKDYSEYLLQAEKKREGVKAITETVSEITVEQAYKIQLETVGYKLNQGHKITGKKIGLTSAAMQQLLGVSEPDYGHLFDYMDIKNHSSVPFNRVMQPKVEGEVAFVLKEDLIGPDITSEDVLKATAFVLPALEIVDSRIADWKIKLADTIADNASSGLYVLGEKRINPDKVNLADIEMHLYKNEELINTGAGADVLGHPANCVAWLANKLADYGISLKAGEVILSGALSAAVDAKPGDSFRASISELGEAAVTFI